MFQFTIREFESAKSFLDYLRLSNAHWEGFKGRSEFDRFWYFRGQGNADMKKWPLTARSLRDKEEYIELMQTRYLEKEKNYVVSATKDYQYSQENEPSVQEVINLRNALEHSISEILLVNEFVELAERALGFSIPEINTWHPLVNRFCMRNVIDLFTNETEAEKIWSHPIMFLAQHHGLPTRLLDWTHNPIKAAFFAAASTDDSSEYIAVYAVRLIYFEWDKVKRVLPPWSLTPNLHAQEGLFTLDLTSNAFFVEHGRYPSLEESITLPEGYEKLDARKLLLPISEVPKLIRLLWLENITAAHLMPTLDNVTNALKLKLKAMK